MLMLIVAIRGGYRMARCWRYTKLECPSSNFFWHVLCVILFIFVLFVIFCFCCYSLAGAFLCCRCSSDIFCPADYVQDWQTRILLCNELDVQNGWEENTRLRPDRLIVGV